MLGGDNLGGLLDNLLKKVYSFVKNNALELVKTLLRELVHCGGLFESLEACAILGPTPHYGIGAPHYTMNHALRSRARR